VPISFSNGDIKNNRKEIKITVVTEDYPVSKIDLQQMKGNSVGFDFYSYGCLRPDHTAEEIEMKN